MKKVFLLGLLLNLLWAPPVFTQDKKPVIRVESFTFEGLGPHESQIIRTLFHSYLETLGTLVYPAPGGPDLPPEVFSQENAGISGAEIIPDFVFSARVIFDRDTRQLIVTVGNVQSGEISSFNSTYATTGELLLKARVFMESVLAAGAPAEGKASLIAEDTERTAPREIRAEPVSGEKIAGIWRGDHGIEMVRLRRDGQGLAVFSSGAQMELSYTIAGNTLFITQNSPNHERYYHPLPYRVAKVLADRADPMRWEFLLYDNGNTLRGTHISTAALYEGERVLELIPHSARESGWTRTGR
jgi:hypothetical protein